MKNGDAHSNPEHASTAQKVEKVIEEVAAKGRALADEGMEIARDVWEENAEKFKKQAAEWGVDEMADDLRTYVRKNPWKSLAIAAGAGLVVGLLLRSSQSRRDE